MKRHLVMNSSSRVKGLWRVLLLLGTAHIAHPAQAKEDEQLFAKALPSKQKIVVLRHEVEGEAKAQAQQKVRERAKSLPPGVTSLMPDHFYTISYNLSSADGKTQGELWQMPWTELDKYPSNFTVFDASYEESSATLVLVYKTRGATHAEVVDTKRTQGTENRKVPLILEDAESSGAVVTSVELSGSIAKGNLTASGTNNLGELYILRWTGGEWKLTGFQRSRTSTNPNIKMNVPFSQRKPRAGF